MHSFFKLNKHHSIGLPLITKRHHGSEKPMIKVEDLIIHQFCLTKGAGAAGR